MVIIFSQIVISLHIMIYSVYIFDREQNKPVKVLETSSQIEAETKKKSLALHGELTFIDYEEDK
jgi:hypothetical protein